MKNSLKILSVSLVAVLMSCNNKTKTADATSDSISMADVKAISAASEVIPGSYINLRTGKTVYIVKDAKTGYAVDSIEQIPVDFYINTATNDTLYMTGLVVNNAIIREEDGTWKLDETKIKIDGDKSKIKNGDYKEKINGEESKIKDGDYKEKVDGEEGKIKDDDSKIKMENGEVTKQKTK